MKKLALITLILLFLMLFTSLSKLFSNNCFNNDLFANKEYEMNKPGCFIIFSSFNKPAGCFCEHVKIDTENNLPASLSHIADKDYSIIISGQIGENAEQYEFHNTSEMTIGYFLIH